MVYELQIDGDFRISEENYICIPKKLMSYYNFIHFVMSSNISQSISIVHLYIY